MYRNETLEKVRLPVRNVRTKSANISNSFQNDFQHPEETANISKILPTVNACNEKLLLRILQAFSRISCNQFNNFGKRIIQ